MNLFLAAEDSVAALRSELAASFPKESFQEFGPLLLGSRTEGDLAAPLPHLAFARQWFPAAYRMRAETISGWAHQLIASIADALPDGPWMLHVEPHYGARLVHRIGARAWHTAKRSSSEAPPHTAVERQPSFASNAGKQRCRLIGEAVLSLLRKKRRQLLKHLLREPAAFTPDTSLVQLLLTSPELGFISVARAPIPFDQRYLLSPFPKGEIRVAGDQAAPSRAFAKIVEAQLRMGRSIQAEETCIDLGASPGSWTYVAVKQGATVIAVDRSALRDDLMKNRRVRFHRADAFRFSPAEPVDWLLCDVIAPPERSAALLLEWLRRRWCRNFIVTIKLGDQPGTHLLEILKRDVLPKTADLFITRLCANKKEICVFGSAADPPAAGSEEPTSETARSDLC